MMNKKLALALSGLVAAIVVFMLVSALSVTSIEDTCRKLATRNVMLTTNGIHREEFDIAVYQACMNDE